MCEANIMSKTWILRGGLILVGLLTLGVVWAGKTAPKIETFKGKVVPLTDLLAKSDIKLDSDAAPHWLALVTDDGKVYPIVKETGGRMFFKDKTLLNRAMQLSGRVVPGSMLLQVSVVNSLHKGKAHEVYYWCDICAIKRGEKNDCECCGGPMELKEDEIKR
jgi:hypothetical protein